MAQTVALCLVATCPAAAQVRDLTELSLEELSNLEVTSVSKSSELLRRAPAAVYVITREDILRSGVTSLPEALRLAPNLHLSQYSASRYVAGARGFAGHEEAQNFSNKLLILIDGRSVYSPLFSGIYMDAQDVLLEDVERIEVISGPGATLWGANAMHGVINIITRPAYLTEGSFASSGLGNLERNASVRYGGKPHPDLAVRGYMKAFERDAMELADGSSAHDDWHKVQGGFRADWSGIVDSVTVQGDLYRGIEHQLGRNRQRLTGGNALGRWQRRSERSQWVLQGFYDHTEREETAGGAGFTLRTYDIELQHTANLGGAHRLISGAGARLHRYRITNSTALSFVPNERTLTLANVFLQDTIALAPSLELTLGLKFEDDPFSGWSPLPEAKVAWSFGDSGLLWASAARAIRSPTPFDRDVVERVNGTVLLTGNPDFQPERVNAFELGVRGRPSSQLSFTVAAFYNVYDDLRTIELAPPPDVFPLRWGNAMQGETYGLEAWGKWQATERWRLSPGVRWLHKRLELKPTASGLLGVQQAGNDPRSQALLTSSLDLNAALTFDATLRYVDSLPSPRLRSYHDLSASLAWRATDGLQLQLSGFNLLDARHLEYPAPSGVWIRRSVIASAQWRF